MSNPTQEEKLNAEEAVVIADPVTPEAPALPLAPDTVEAIVASIIGTPAAVEVLAVALFNNPTFKKALATAFVAIYDNVVRAFNSAERDFESQFQVRLLAESEGNDKEFFIRYVSDESLEFSVTDETGARTTYPETHPGALKAALKALKAANIQPSTELLHIALIEPVVGTVTINGVEGVIATSEFTSDPSYEAVVTLTDTETAESVH